MSTNTENLAPQTTTEAEDLRPWHTLWQLTRVYKGKFLVVVLFSLLATGSDLIAPLIYRTAINDVAGLFVDDTRESPEDSQLPDEEAPPPTTSASPAPEVSPGVTPAPTAPKVLTPPQSLHALPLQPGTMTDVLKVTAAAAVTKVTIQCKPNSHRRRQNRTAKITSRRALLRRLFLP